MGYMPQTYSDMADPLFYSIAEHYMFRLLLQMVLSITQLRLNYLSYIGFAIVACKHGTDQLVVGTSFYSKVQCPQQ